MFKSNTASASREIFELLLIVYLNEDLQISDRNVSLSHHLERDDLAQLKVEYDDSPDPVGTVDPYLQLTETGKRRIEFLLNIAALLLMIFSKKNALKFIKNWRHV